MSGHYRFRRSFGNVGSLFRGARPDTYPRLTGLLDTYGGAAAAYSLRALSSGWIAGDVVEVRPSSGWTPASFTAGQVANGELVDYVKRPGNFTNFPANGFETLVNNGTGDGFFAINTSQFGIAQSFTVSGVASNEVTIDFDLSITSGSPSCQLRSGQDTASASVLPASGSNSITLTATGVFDNFSFTDGDVPSEFTVSNVRVSTNDGFVSTWYDQSGNGNDATQATTTSQPKIVSAGSLVTGGLDFDGADDYMQSAAFTAISQPTTRIAVANFSNVGATRYVIDGSVANRGVIGTTSAPAWRIFAGTVANYATGPSVSTDYLLFGKNSGASSELSVNGVGLGLKDAGTAALDQVTIGANAANTTNGLMLGTINEIIVYGSDQSANRVGIEANINAAYSIY